MPEPVWLTIPQAAARVKRSARTVERWRDSGDLSVRMVNGRGMVREDQLLALFRERLRAWPIHRQRMNVQRRQDGLPPLPPPVKVPAPAVVPQPRIQAIQDESDPYPEPEPFYDPLNGMLERFPASAEHAELLAALKATPAPCKDVPAFVQDRPPDVAALGAICANCPVLAQCDAYARAAKIKTGFWAGVDRGRLSANPASTPQNERARTIVTDMLRAVAERAAG